MDGIIYTISIITDILFCLIIIKMMRTSYFYSARVKLDNLLI